MQGLADIGNFGFGVVQQRPGHRDFSGIHFWRAATVSSPCPRSSQSGLGPLADKFPFEFRESAEDMKDQFPTAVVVSILSCKL